MRKRWYILFVARDADGQLRKIPIPIHYLYVFLAGALIGMFTLTGMAGSYARIGSEPPPSAEFEAAVASYRAKFSVLLERTAGDVQRLGHQFGEWLKNREPGADDGEAEDETVE